MHQLGTKNFLIIMKISSIGIKKEVDSDAERSTIPLSVFKQKLAGLCKLQSSTVSLHQYDNSPLMVSCKNHYQSVCLTSHFHGNGCTEPSGWPYYSLM